MPAARIVTRHLTGDRSNPASITEGCVVGSKLHSDLLSGRYNFTRHDSQPSLSKSDGNVAATGATGDENIALFRSGLTARYHVKGAGQTLLGPLLDATGKGLEVSQDQTATEGVEYVFGTNSTAGSGPNSGPFSFVVGTDPGFSARLRFRVTAVTNITELAFGWRKQQTFAATMVYTDFAVIDVITAGVVNVKTNLNNAGIATTVTGKTWVADETHTLEVRLIGTRAVYLFDNAPLTGMPEFNADAGDLYEPFFFLIQGTTPTTVFWVESEFGPRRQLTSNLSTQG